MTTLDKSIGILSIIGVSVEKTHGLKRFLGKYKLSHPTGIVYYTEAIDNPTFTGRVIYDIEEEMVRISEEVDDITHIKKYEKILIEICSNGESPRKHFMATSDQRVEAMLKTFGKWTQ